MMSSDKDRQDRNRRPLGEPQRWVLICNDSTCGLRLTIGFPRYCVDPCPRCGAPMACRLER